MILSESLIHKFASILVADQRSWAARDDSMPWQRITGDGACRFDPRVHLSTGQ
jgi:hypothetical protein